MLFTDDPASLIRRTMGNFNIQPDKLAVARLMDSLETLQQAREMYLGNSQEQLKTLKRQLNGVNAQHAELAAQHSSADHASSIARLDTAKFRTAKAASDAEMEAERAAQRAADLAARLQELELQGVEGNGSSSAEKRDASVDDEVLLRLKVYRSLGIDLERDEGDGEWARAIVRNDRRGDVHVVNMDKKFTRYFYANYFWGSL